MQCWSCGFENIPGAQACARCASRMNLDGVGVEPPRATRLRAVTHLSRARYRVRSMVPDFGRLWARLGIVVPAAVDRRALAWSFIPGLGHLKTGRLRLGRWLLPAWLALLVLAFAGIGCSWVRFVVAAMVAVHALAVVSLFAADLAFERIVIRAAFGVLLFLSLQFFVYDPVIWFSTRFVVAVAIHSAIGHGVIEDGDGLLYQGPWVRPGSFSRGDTVVYRLTGLHVPGYLLGSGMGVNRVVGVPGDRVQQKDGILLVNGHLPREGERPLRSTPMYGDFDIELGPREYAVFTATERRNQYAHHRGVNEGVPEAIVRQLSVVSYDDILGRAILRLHPFSRFGRLK